MKKVYIIGIEGAGTSALAGIYSTKGYEVSGSDDGDGFYRKNLVAKGIKVHESYDVTHVPDDVDFVVHSTALTDENLEIAVSKKKGLTVMTYPEAVSELTREHLSFAVCGTHGKTTTTGLLTHALVGAGRDPLALVGASVVGWEGGMRSGAGREFVLEADEYQDKLALYHPHAVILTSIDYDHPDFFPTKESYRKAFERFVARIPRTGVLVAQHDDWDIQKVVTHAQCKVLTYGEHSDADAVLVGRSHVDGLQHVTVRYEKQDHEFVTVMPGKHNAMNAIAAWLLSSEITGDTEGSAEGISQYRGVARRFEKKSEISGAQIIDDYAHHPEAIRTTLATMREVHTGKKLIAAFHPHSHSRTHALLEDMARALDLADEVIILDIFPVDRENEDDFPVHASDLVDAINQKAQTKAQHIATVEELKTWTQENLTPEDAFITLGAGNIYKVHGE